METDEEKIPQIHHPDAGDVGETGDHGDLGGNAVDAERQPAHGSESYAEMQARVEREGKIRDGSLPSGADLDADAAEKAATAATTGGEVVEVPAATDAKPAPNAEEIKAQIAGSLVLAGYSQEEAVNMAETAIANKNK